MANTKAAKKAHRTSLRKREYNSASKNKIKSALKNLRNAVSGASGGYQDALAAAYSALDKAAKTNYIPKARADRKKSRLAKMISRATQTA